MVPSQEESEAWMTTHMLKAVAGGALVAGLPALPLICPLLSCTDAYVADNGDSCFRSSSLSCRPFFRGGHYCD